MSDGPSSAGLDPSTGSQLVSHLDSQAGVTVLPIYANPGLGRFDSVVSCSAIRALPALGACAPGVGAVQAGVFDLIATDNPIYFNKDLPAVSHSSRPATESLSKLGVSALLVKTSDPDTRERVRTYLTNFEATSTETSPSRVKGGGALGEWQMGILEPETFGEVAQIRNNDDRNIEKVVLAIVLLTLIVAGCSLAVSVAGSLLDRKRPFTLLRLSGTPLKTLTRVVLLESLVPLVAATVVAAGVAIAIARASRASTFRGEPRHATGLRLGGPPRPRLLPDHAGRVGRVDIGRVGGDALVEPHHPAGERKVRIATARHRSKIVLSARKGRIVDRCSGSRSTASGSAGRVRTSGRNQQAAAGQPSPYRGVQWGSLGGDGADLSLEASMSVSETFALAGPVAVVTGGNRGLGRPSRTPSVRPARPSPSSLGTRTSAEVVAELAGKGISRRRVRGRRARAAPTSSAPPGDHCGVRAVDILVNNAGTCIHRPALEVHRAGVAAGLRRQRHRGLERLPGRSGAAWSTPAAG